MSDSDAPLAMYSPPPQPPSPPPTVKSVFRLFAKRSLSNVKHGNPALLVVFLSCFVIFARALCGAGYDEAFSADADAQIQKHPSLLTRWGPASQHALEQRWKSLGLRKSAGAGLLGKIKKEDADADSTLRMIGARTGDEALHWFHLVEDRLARRRHDDALPREHPAPHDDLTALPAAHDDMPQLLIIADPEEPHPAPDLPPPQHVVPEHDISEDLDEHDAPEDPAEYAAPPRHDDAAPAPPKPDEEIVAAPAPAIAQPHGDDLQPAQDAPPAAASPPDTDAPAAQDAPPVEDAPATQDAPPAADASTSSDVPSAADPLPTDEAASAPAPPPVDSDKHAKLEDEADAPVFNAKEQPS